jgi:hypothetical protein
MSDTPKIGTWAAVDEGCPISYKVSNDDEIDFMFGDVPRYFEFAFDLAALRQFVTLANKALQEIEA